MNNIQYLAKYLISGGGLFHSNTFLIFPLLIFSPLIFLGQKSSQRGVDYSLISNYLIPVVKVIFTESLL